ncbi:MAG: 2-oxoglutarate dehydrogenase E1 component, partial [Bacteroidetes bacterium]
VKRVLLCTGKVYYELLEKQQADSRTDIAIVRLEQLHPLPQKQIDAVLAPYKKAELCWVQEEPLNMGYYTYLLREMDVRLRPVTRPAAASPATGFAKIHAQEQAAIVAKAFE